MCTYEPYLWCISFIGTSGIIAVVISMAQDRSKRDQEEKS